MSYINKICLILCLPLAVGILYFQRDKPGRSLTEKNLSLRSSVLQKKGLFESVYDFLIFVLKK